MGLNKLTATEKRLYLYLKNGGSTKIDDITRELKINRLTLIAKTLPSLMNKKGAELAAQPPRY